MSILPYQYPARYSLFGGMEQDVQVLSWCIYMPSLVCSLRTFSVIVCVTHVLNFLSVNLSSFCLKSLLIISNLLLVTQFWDLYVCSVTSDLDPSLACYL